MSIISTSSPWNWEEQPDREPVEKVGETRDGLGSSDHDEPYAFGRANFTVDYHYPFTERTFAKLMILRGRVRDGFLTGDTA